MRSAATSTASFTALMKFATRMLMPLAFVLVHFAPAARGQSAIDGFDPNANGEIRAIAVQPDGKILIGGSFTSLAPNGDCGPRNYIARLNRDGTLDAAFDPNADNFVNSIAVQADGKILVVGEFDSIGKQERHFIARLDPVSGLADSFNPNANDFVNALALQADGNILVGGLFTRIGGVTRNYIARINPTTGVADSFNPDASNTVVVLAVQPDGMILAGGFFHAIGGQLRNNIARVDPTSGLADSFNPNANTYVDSIALQANGKILIGGGFSLVGGEPRAGLPGLIPLRERQTPSTRAPMERFMRLQSRPMGKLLWAVISRLLADKTVRI